MRIVLDTNVVVSGILSETGAPAQVLELCIAGDATLLVDGRIVGEYRDVLYRPALALDRRDVDQFLGLLQFAEHVVASPLPLSLRDPDDLPFLEVAVSAVADAIVTGNARHFRAFEGKVDMPILTPRQCLNRIAGK